MLVTTVHGRPNPTTNINTAVEFLEDVHGKGYNEAAVRGYLIKKQGLTVSEVNEAFKIQKERVSDRIQESARKPLVLHKVSPKRIIIGNCNNIERPERSVGIQKTKKPNMPSFLSHKKTYGETFLSRFLNSEKKYCELLSCLWNQYYMVLTDIAYLDEIKITPKTLREIFLRTSILLNFHKKFYKDLMEGAEIGRMFVRLFVFFKGYLEYMKNLTSAIERLGKHLGDQSFRKCLGKIRKNTKFQKYHLIDLLVFPLDRIIEYKRFLDNLLQIVDKSQQKTENLNKASRRIGRVASYIEKYKWVITNLHELYKAQLFISGEIKILDGNRRILRRGVMRKRKTGWRSRSKDYCFFLFNDILLWASKSGKYQRGLPLFSCKVLPWDEGNRSERRLKIVHTLGEKVNILLLECDTPRQRNDWYSSLEQAILNSSLGEESVDLQSVLNYEDSEDEETQYASGKSESPEEKQTERRATRDEEKCKVVFEPSLKLLSPIKAEEKRLDDDLKGTEYDYERSRNFNQYVFDGFDTLDDTSSQISDSEVRFYEENSAYRELREGSTIDQMSPFSPCSLKRSTFPSKEPSVGSISLQEVYTHTDIQNANSPSRTRHSVEIGLYDWNISVGDSKKGENIPRYRIIRRPETVETTNQVSPISVSLSDVAVDKKLAQK